MVGDTPLSLGSIIFSTEHSHGEFIRGQLRTCCPENAGSSPDKPSPTLNTAPSLYNTDSAGKKEFPESQAEVEVDKPMGVVQETESAC